SNSELPRSATYYLAQRAVKNLVPRFAQREIRRSESNTRNQAQARNLSWPRPISIPTTNDP
ncbi:hypothetical protein A2U01_0094567, partial [Trifolium medium]|nr:hypothetical protein [Trifolium medium]